MNSFKSLVNWFVTIHLTTKFICACYRFSLVPKLTLVNCSSSITIQLAMVRSCTHSWTCVSSTIIFLTFRWKKPLGKCCLTMLSGIINFTTNTSIGLIGCFKTNFAMIIFGIIHCRNMFNMSRYYYGSYKK